MKYLIPFMFIAALAAAAFADDQAKEYKLTGTVKQVFAIGAETTGWGLALDFETAISGKIFKQIELDPGDTNMEQYKNQRVEVTGTLTEKTGIERGKYSVLKVLTIKKIE